MALNPEIPEYYCFRGEIKFMLGETEGARKFCNEASARPTDARYFDVIGALTAGIGDKKGIFNQLTNRP